MKILEKQDGVYLTTSLGIDQGIELELDHQTPWVASLLEELEEDVDSDFDEIIKGQPSFLKIHVILEKHHNGTYGEFFTLAGEVEGLFNTYCVGTGGCMKDSIHSGVKAIFLESRLEKELEFDEETELFWSDSEYDLYYYDRKLVDLKSAIHEYLFLNKDPYPRL